MIGGLTEQYRPLIMRMENGELWKSSNSGLCKKYVIAGRSFCKKKGNNAENSAL